MDSTCTPPASAHPDSIIRKCVGDCRPRDPWRQAVDLSVFLLHAGVPQAKVDEIFKELVEGTHRR